mmetsp:Transcript_6582/g.15701  ORF Transcript_6582/g.15701 Transcript_6582/m.15701 type:complete len:275 (-) Transcript_6582:587-1411(-)
MLVTQSRMASLMASFKVCDPLFTATTLAPNIFILNTFSFCLSTSTAPMYTMHSIPNSAQAVAVATPCWPAPVSAMMRLFPIFLAKRACPTALLILWAPVWANSSRLNQIWAPPIFSESLFAWYNGVGPPMNSFLKRATSALNSGSTLHLLYISSSSSCAFMRVSGINLPPNPVEYFHLSPAPMSIFALFAGGSEPALWPWHPLASLRTSAPISGIPFSRAETMAEPTTTPSAQDVTSLTCSSVDTPNPTIQGMPSDWSLKVFTMDATELLTLAR